MGLIIAVTMRSAEISSAVIGLGGSTQSTAAPELILQTGHSRSVKAIVFGPENKWIATGAFDNTIKIWDITTGHELRTLSGHSAAVNTLVRSRDGTMLASASNDNSVILWNVAAGKEIRRFEAQADVIRAVAISADGGAMAFNGPDNSIQMRSTHTGDPLWVISEHSAPVTALAFSLDGKLLASGSTDSTVKIWTTENGQVSKTLKGHAQAVRSVNFSGDSQVLASSDDKTVRQWTTSNWRETARTPLVGERLLDFRILSDSRVSAVDSDRIVREAGRERNSKLVETARCVSRTGVTEAGGFSEDGKLLAFGNGDGTVTVCDASNGTSQALLENHTVGSYDVDISHDQRWIGSAGFDNTVRLWDLQTGQSLPPLRGHTGRVTAVAFRAETDQIVSGSVDKTIRIWSVLSATAPTLLTGHSDTVQSLAVQSNGNLLVSGSSDQTIGIWDLRDPSLPPRFLKDHRGEVTSVDISAGGDLVVSGGSDRKLRIWNIVTDSVLHTLEVGSEIDSVAFSPDGKRIATGSSDNTIRVWDSTTGRLLSAKTGHSGRIYSVNFSGDGSRIVSASLDKTSRVWSVAENREIAILGGHEGIVYSAVFSPDQRFVATASDDGSLILWGESRPLARLITFKQTDDWLVVTPNGFFDGSPAAWERISWRFDKDTFRFATIEIFFSEFFAPGVLTDVLKAGNPPPGSPISTKDRRQPAIRLTAELSDVRRAVERDIKINIEVNDAGAGAQDVRLFRNGSLVRIWRGNVLQGQKAAKLEATIPVTAGENVFTAYAFNSENIKSKDARLTISGDQSLLRKGIFYLFTIGVNEYENSDFNLNYAVADVRDVSNEFRIRQSGLNIYERVKIVELIDRGATKKAILDTLRGLSSRLQPEDVLMIYFAGHGMAHQDRFYLIPHDLGYTGLRDRLDAVALTEIFRNSISDLELERLFESMDCGQITFVIDACNSGQLLENEEKRRGPMNSKGLAQLAYEKGMYILTAAQSYQTAKEASRLGHGFLTFALVEEGLRKGLADFDPKDGRILLREWLDFAAARVPQINEEAIAERKLEREKNKKLIIFGQTDVQRPRVFYRRESESRPLIVARSDRSK